MVFEQDFPFEEHRGEGGQIFSRISELLDAGFETDQIWSITESGEDDGCLVYGPSYHWVNLIGYIATTERHDNNTYYIEDWSDIMFGGIEVTEKGGNQ